MGTRRWSMLELARLGGVTRRTLRHYAEIGLLTPAHLGSNGYRYYGQAELLRLQRILLLREMGLGLPAIQSLLDDQQDSLGALRSHLEWLRRQSERLQRQERTVARTVERLERGEPLMAEEVLDGFEYEHYREEVERRWGGSAWATGDAWWRGLDSVHREGFQREVRALAEAWAGAKRAGVEPLSEEARVLARRHVAWLKSVPGTPAADATDSSPELHRYVEGLATMYVEDPRFAQSYDRLAPGTAELVRDALLGLWTEPVG